jgi:hypothetical protein
MPSSPCLLCALVPPGSVEAEVARVQEALFAEHGLASAVAVPPVVPVAFLEASVPCGELLGEMNRAVPAGWRMALRDPAWVDGHLFARVESGGAWGALHACAECRGRAANGGPFPVSEGFYLGCAEALPPARVDIRPTVPALSFSSATLAILRIDFAPFPDWWSELHWEVVGERPLRGRRSA